MVSLLHRATINKQQSTTHSIMSFTPRLTADCRFDLLKTIDNALCTSLYRFHYFNVFECVASDVVQQSRLYVRTFSIRASVRCVRTVTVYVREWLGHNHRACHSCVIGKRLTFQQLKVMTHCKVAVESDFRNESCTCVMNTFAIFPSK